MRKVDEEEVALNILEKYTTDTTVINALLEYNRTAFPKINTRNALALPLPNEPHLADWKWYQVQASKRPLLDVLKTKLIPLNFPIKKNISLNPNYKKATLKGFDIKKIPEATGLTLHQKDGLSLMIKKGLAGSIPVIIVENPTDFKQLLRALAYRNEPIRIPSAMGASIIKGVNNWQRLQMALLSVEKPSLLHTPKAIQRSIIANKALYQDTIIIVSQKPYSNIYPPNYKALNWLNASLKIRIEHEYAHYATQRLFGVMRNHLHDELLADYLGIHAIAAQFDASLFLQFMGLANYPHYRSGGRMENYTDMFSMNSKAFDILKTLLYQAALNVEQFDSTLQSIRTNDDLFARFLTLTQFSLIELASKDNIPLLKEKYSALTS